MTDFYRAFEERHRGSRAVVKERLRAYLPFLQPLARALPEPTAMDLGCGRGEWLELLGELGFRAHGVDLDDEMLEACRSAGLSADRAEALGSLRALPDGSQALVSAFHLVEHLPFDSVQTLVAEALRVLAPGGLLVLETPNPENIVVATSGFYLDPTHQRPLPPELLAFLPEFHGFARVKTVRLQEPPALHGAPAVTLYDVLGSASPDYGVVAQKQGSPQQMEALDEAFAMSFGISLTELARRYEEGRRAELGVVEDHANRLAEQARAFEAMLTGGRGRSSASRLEQEVQALRERLAHTDARLSAVSALVASMTEELHQEEAKRLELEQSVLHSQPFLDRTAAGASSGAQRRTLRERMFSVVEDHPQLRLRIVNLARRLRIHGVVRRGYRWLTGRTDGGGPGGTAAELPPLTPHAQEIQELLKAATDPQRRKSP